jgi:beta-galactosidase
VRPNAAPQALPGVAGIAYGGDYNPEQWPEEIWAEDVRLMAEAGVNLVTVGVFSWTRLQPAPGELTAGWLDRVLDLLHTAKIRVDLATATASPPAWLVSAHPEILPVTATGTRLSFGSRQHYCPSSSAYRDAAVDLVGRLAARYRDHPALELWHIGNEYGCHVPACWCDVSAEAFRTWLQDRYGDLDGLNHAWGTAFWSQGYTRWDQVVPPRAAPTFPNPGQQLDFARFSSSELLACFLAERNVLAAEAPDVPVTTNFLGLHRAVDGWAWARHEDVVSVDSYPDPADPDAAVGSALVADLTRSLGSGRPWLLMEQAPSAVNWRRTNVPKAPGQLRAFSLQAVGRGSDAVLSFQWRASRAGAEKFHSGMVPHAGTNSRVWAEVVALGADLQALAPVAGQRVKASVAILHDWESWWAMELDSHPSADLHLMDQLMAVYRPLHAAGVTVDFAHPEADLDPYRLVIVPSLYLVSDEGAARVRRHVEQGGVVVMTFFSGIVDQSDHVRLGGYPAPWVEMLGLSIEELAPLPPDEQVPLAGEALEAGALGRLWCDDISLRGATTLARYAAGTMDGRPAVTMHRWGRGSAIYLGTLPDEGTLRGIVDLAIAEAGVEPAAQVPAGVEAVVRGDHLFLINHRDQPVDVPLASGDGGTSSGVRKDLLSGTMVASTAHLSPRGVVVLAGPVGGAQRPATGQVAYERDDQARGGKEDRPCAGKSTT